MQLPRKKKLIHVGTLMNMQISVALRASRSDFDAM